MLAESRQIKKLIKIVETFPVSGYYSLVHLYYCAAELEKNAFLLKLKAMLASNKDRKIQQPF